MKIQQYIKKLRDRTKSVVEWPQDLNIRPIKAVIVDLSKVKDSDGFNNYYDPSLFDPVGIQSLVHRLNFGSSLVSCDYAILPPDKLETEVIDHIKSNRSIESIGFEALKPKKLDQFDIIGISYVNSMDILRLYNTILLSGTELYAENRKENDPYIIVGGDGANNPIALTPFAEIVILGDSEESLLEVSNIISENKEKLSRNEILRLIASKKIDGVFVPKFPSIVSPAKIAFGHELADGYKYIAGSVFVQERLDQNGNAITPASLLLSRKCRYDCSFCQMSSGVKDDYSIMPFKDLEEWITTYSKAGVKVIHLLAAIASHYYDSLGKKKGLADVVEKIIELEMFGVYLADRPEKLPKLLDSISNVQAQGGKRSMALAPESSPRLRKSVLNKTISEKALEKAVLESIGKIDMYKINQIVGIPGENLEDLAYGVRMAEYICDLAEGQNHPVEITVSIFPLIPSTLSNFETAGVVDETTYLQVVKALQDEAIRISKKYKHSYISVKPIKTSGYLLENIARRGNEKAMTQIAQLYTTMLSEGSLESFNERFRAMVENDPKLKFILDPMPIPHYREYVSTANRPIHNSTQVTLGKKLTI